MPFRNPLQPVCSSYFHSLVSQPRTASASRSLSRFALHRPRRLRAHEPAVLAQWQCLPSLTKSVSAKATSDPDGDALEETLPEPAAKAQRKKDRLSKGIHDLPILRSAHARIKPPQDDAKMAEWMEVFLRRREHDRQAEADAEKITVRLEFTPEERAAAAERAASILEKYRDQIDVLRKDEPHMSEEQVYSQYDAIPTQRTVREEMNLAETTSKSTKRAKKEPEESVSSDISGIELDASSRLSTYSANLSRTSWRRKAGLFLALTKPRLSFLVTLTTVAAYAIYPTPELLDQLDIMGNSPLLDPATLLFLAGGTFLSAACANACNMLLEPKYDSQMSRTRNRPLARGLLSPRAAMIFAALTGVAGFTSLYVGANPTTALLGAANILLYVGVYTPLKRVHWINTWVGALVGGIPPLMGWTAAAGLFAPSAGTDPIELLFKDEAALSGWALAALLLLWQIPHFAAVSWGVRHEYANAGYKMLAWMNPGLDAKLSLLCTMGMFVPPVVLDWQGVIEPPATFIATFFNSLLLWRAFLFMQNEGAFGSARRLFFASHWYLAMMMIVFMVGKKNFLSNYWNRTVGDEEEDGVYEEEDEVNTLKA